MAPQKRFARPRARAPGLAISAAALLVAASWRRPAGALAFLPAAPGLQLRRPDARTRRAAGPEYGGGAGGAPSSPLEQLDALIDGPLLTAKAVAESDLGRGSRDILGEERFESVKTSALAIIFAVVPEAVTGWLDPERLTPRWEFQLDMLALQVLLFGLVYRYAVREGDENPMLRAGVLAAFVLPRAFFLVEMPAECVTVPLNCGPPLGYFNWSMLAQVVKHAVIGGVVLGSALYGLERAFAVGLIRRFGGSAVPATTAALDTGAKEAVVGWRLPWE